MAAYTTIDDPEAYFQAVLYTGDGNNSRTITLPGDTDMQPDMVWIKERGSTSSHYLIDSVRGAGVRLEPDATTTESTEGVSAFASDGFTIGTSTNQVNQDGITHVAWCWKAGSSDTAVSASGTGDGAINACTHRANTTSLFSIIEYTGRNDQISNNEHTKITHGLGTKPDFLIIKDLDGAQNWCVTTGTDNDGHYRLDTNAALDTSLFTGNQNNSDTTHFLVGNETMVNYSIRDFVAYAWTSVQGFSKFGTYEGNGNANGPFIYTGFKPAFVILKEATTTSQWYIFDNKMNPHNEMVNAIHPDLNNAETTDNKLDFYSNGFKIRKTSTDLNTDGNKHIYAAFAEAPLVNSEGVPNNAR